MEIICVAFWLTQHNQECALSQHIKWPSYSIKGSHQTSAFYSNVKDPVRTIKTSMPWCFGPYYPENYPTIFSGLQTPLQFSPAILTLNSWQLLDADSSIITVWPIYTQMESINCNKSWLPYCIATNSCHLINYAYKHINYGYLASVYSDHSWNQNQ